MEEYFEYWADGGLKKEIQSQRQGQGTRGVNYLSYWLNFLGEDVEQK